MKAISLFILLGMLTSCEGFHIQGHVKAEKTSHQSMHSTTPTQVGNFPQRAKQQHHDYPSISLGGQGKAVTLDITE